MILVEETLETTKHVHENNTLAILRGVGIGSAGLLAVTEYGTTTDLSSTNYTPESDEENPMTIAELGAPPTESVVHAEDYDPPHLLDLGEKLVITGGNTSINVGGTCVAKHGAIRDHARGSEAASLNGKTAEPGGKAAKNSLGHLPKDSTTGLEGIPGPTIKVIPKPSFSFKKVTSPSTLPKIPKEVTDIAFSTTKLKVTLIVTEPT